MEKQIKLKESLKAFEKAIELLTLKSGFIILIIGFAKKELYLAYENKARVLCSLKNYKESIACYELIISNPVMEADAFIYAGYGLALYFDGQLMDSLLAFEKSLSKIEDGIVVTSNDVKLMLSQVLFALGTPQHIDLAKQQLLQW